MKTSAKMFLLGLTVTSMYGCAISHPAYTEFKTNYSLIDENKLTETEIAKNHEWYIRYIEDMNYIDSKYEIYKNNHKPEDPLHREFKEIIQSSGYSCNKIVDYNIENPVVYEARFFVRCETYERSYEIYKTTSGNFAIPSYF